MKSKNILIVENKEQERKLFEYLIGQLYSFSSFGSGQDALNHIAQQSAHLVLLSLQLPDLDPIHLLQNAKKMWGKSCLVVAVASNGDESNIHYFRSQGFDEVLSKPIRPKEFILKIQSLLAKLEEESKNSTVAESVPILNTETYQQLVRLSSKEVIDQVYVEFVQECNSLFQLLDPNSRAMPSEEILRAIHTIKGNSGTLGVEKIYAAAKCSESLGRQQKSIEFAESLHYLKATLVELEEFLRKEPNL
jgi:two-component system, OmpR family, alkaline phosphatase synthesis response regulator PhoP